MSISEFSQLSNNEKGSIVFSSGKFIGIRNYYNQTLVLYDLGNYFAEVWYEPMENKITKIETISPTDNKINRYIDSALKSVK